MVRKLRFMMSTTRVPLIPELTPDQQLAATISQELVTKGLVAEGKREVLATKLATGQMKAEDWRTLIAGSLHIDDALKGGEA